MEHQFIKISPIDTKKFGSNTFGVVVGCAICGQTRIIYENGVIEITNKGQKEHHERGTETDN